MKGKTCGAKIENEPCTENQIRFTLNRFRFSQNVLLDHPLCGRAVMRNCQTSLQSYRFDFSPIPSRYDDTLAYRLLMGKTGYKEEPQQREQNQADYSHNT